VDILSKRLQHPGQKIKASQEKLVRLQKELVNLIKNKLVVLNKQLANTARMLHAVSPLNTLDRGYAIVKQANTNKIITSADQLKIGSDIEVILRHGSVTAEVTAIQESTLPTVGPVVTDREA
jgi:exodeoxyribonuclease VII large subunit